MYQTQPLSKNSNTTFEYLTLFCEFTNQCLETNPRFGCFEIKGILSNIHTRRKMYLSFMVKETCDVSTTAYI